MPRFRILVVVAAAFGGGAWFAQGDEVRTDPAPVDVMLDEAKAAAGAVPESEPRSVRLANTLRPRAEWDLPQTYNDRVQYWIDFLAGANRERTQLWLEREGRYGRLIRERLYERGMPQDLIYLGMIESGLSPKAYSHAHASGMWQFISETGQRYGLDVNGFVDERRDPVKATDAALDYLEELYDRFGSWYLAAAAYNSGENRVDRILRQRAGGQKGSDDLFWRIDEYLPRETRDYVPLMLAAAHIGKDPGRYGFHEVVLQAPLRYEEVEVPGGVSLSTVAKAADLDAASVEELNPHLLRGVTPPGASWRVRVPEGRSAMVAAAGERLAEEQRRSSVTHRVGRGETLSHIARRYGVRVDALRAANGGLDPRRLQVGQRVQVPVGDAATAAAAPASWTTYRVRRGDTLWGIARRHGVSVRQLRSWNGIGNRIYAGQKIRLRA
jgi:membrane-bound lytic murein transglycosylase D